MKTILSVLSLLVLTTVVTAQEGHVPYYESMVFERNTENIEIKETDTSSYGVVLLDKAVVEFYYDEEYDNNLMEYRTFHRRVKLNTERAIKEYNKVYINLNSAIDLVEAKARVIKPDNSVIDLKQSDIKEAENFEQYGRFKYFAFEGIELGADVEYIYTIKRSPDYNGNRFTFQGRSERRNVEFVAVTPRNLEFAFTSLNGFPEVVQDTTDTTRNFYSAQVDVMTAVRSESYSARDASLQCVMYKLDKNKYNNSDRIIHYGQAAQNVYANMHYEVSSTDIKALKGLAKKLKISKLPLEQKLRKMEYWIKTNLNQTEMGGDDLENISKIIANKNCNESGLVKFYVNWLEALDIKYELCLGSDRKELRFLNDFEVYNCLVDYFIYFPEIDQYITPGYWVYRLGLLPHDYTYNYALFMRPITLGEYTTYLADVKWIEPSPKEVTYTNHDISIDLGSGFEKSEITFNTTMAGHEACVFQSSIKSLKPEQLKEYEDILVTFISDEEKALENSFENDDPLDVFVKPFIVHGVVDYPNLIQKAGPKYLVKVGKVIGPQSELYQEKERKLPIELSYNHGYLREITFEIPAGYKVTNLDDLKFNESVESDGEKIMAFTSSYMQEGNQITVTVNEYYNKIRLPKEDYEAFKNVINAAADFNKVVLVFEKG